jgi:hypothetical protein
LEVESVANLGGQMSPLILTVNKMEETHIQAIDFQPDRNNNTAVAFISEHDLSRIEIEIHTLTDPDGIPYKVVDKSEFHEPGHPPAQKFDLEIVNI